MSHSRLLLLSTICVAAIWPAGSAAAVPRPISPVEVPGSGNLTGAAPHVSPDGNQIVTYTASTGGATVSLSERGSQGGPFDDPLVLSSTGNPEPPSVSFTDDGGIYAIWGIASSVAPAEQSFRSPGGTFSPHQPAVGCGRFVDSTAGPGGGARPRLWRLSGRSLSPRPDRSAEAARNQSERRCCDDAARRDLPPGPRHPA